MALLRWPAVVGLVFFVWLELVGNGGGPRSLFIVLVGYTAFTLAMMAQFGRDTWRRDGETFSVWFGVLGRLAPFALVAQLTGDPSGFAAARLACMALGAVNAVLVWKILRPIGMVAALFGGFGYAVFHPAVYSEKSTLLEGPATAALQAASPTASRWRRAASRNATGAAAVPAAAGAYQTRSAG